MKYNMCVNYIIWELSNKHAHHLKKVFFFNFINCLGVQNVYLYSARFEGRNNVL